MAARGSDLWVHVTLCLNTSAHIAALKMAALEAQRIWRSVAVRDAPSTWKLYKFHPISLEVSAAPADRLLGAILCCLMPPTFAFVFSSSTRLYGLSRYECKFALSSSRVLEHIRAELKLDLKRQWANLPWDTLAVLLRMKVETSVCFYGLRPQVISHRCESSNISVLNKRDLLI